MTDYWCDDEDDGALCRVRPEDVSGKPRSRLWVRATDFDEALRHLSVLTSGPNGDRWPAIADVVAATDFVRAANQTEARR